MKFLVAYNGSTASRKALEIARSHAGVMDAVVYVMISMEGGSQEKAADIRNSRKLLKDAKEFLDETGVKTEVSELVRGMAPGKNLVKFAKENEKLEIKAGLLNGRVLAPADIKALAALPSREQLLSKLLSVMVAVPTNFVNVLSGVPRNLVNVLGAIKDKKEAA